MTQSPKSGDMLRELNRVKVLFQMRALCTAMGIDPITASSTTTGNHHKADPSCIRSFRKSAAPRTHCEASPKATASNHAFTGRVA